MTDLLVVAGLPCIHVGGAAESGTGSADIAGHVDGGGTLGDEFFYGFVERLGVHVEALAEDVGHLVVVAEEGGDAGQFGDRGVVAFEEEVVHLAVSEGVEEHGAGG